MHILLSRAIISMALLAGVESVSYANAPPPCLQGSFIQLNRNDHARPFEQWRTLFSYFQQLQLTHLVIQWSAIDGVNFYGSRHRTSGVPLLEALLQLADTTGMRVLVGLAHDSRFWKAAEGHQKEEFLARHLVRTSEVARTIAPMVRRHRSFSGWYISEEIDHLNWHDAESRAALMTYLRDLTGQLDLLTPEAQIAISGFANHDAQPEDYAQLWSDLLMGAPQITTVYFQDGIGVRKQDLQGLPAFYEAMRRVVEQHGKQFIPIVEVFRQTAGDPVSQGRFRAVPAEVRRITRQVELASMYSGDWIAFGIPEYLSPVGGDTAARTFRHYLHRMHQVAADCSGGTHPAALASGHGDT